MLCSCEKWLVCLPHWLIGNTSRRLSDRAVLGGSDSVSGFHFALNLYYEEMSNAASPKSILKKSSGVDQPNEPSKELKFEEAGEESGLNLGKFNSTFRTEKEDEELSKRTRIAEMKFVQHEFVKMSEVGKMISEAFQKFVDKLSEKDKTLTAHKTQLR